MSASQFFTSKLAMVVDPNTNLRGAIVRALTKVGAQSDNVHRFGAWGDAIEFLKTNKPHIVITGYKVGDNFGLELSPLLMALGHPDFERLFVLCANGATESAVAEAAEEDVDAFLLIPFTQSALEESLEKAAESKLTPTPYRKMVSLGKTKLMQKDADTAQQLLTKALTLDPKPTLAHYYLAKLAEQKKSVADAEAHYKAGLKISRTHYRCLTGYFDLLEREQKIGEAFELLRLMVQTFPVSAARLGKAIRLAIHSNHLEDIQPLYAQYLNLTERTPEVVKTVSSALVLLGKVLLGQNKEAEAFDAIQKAITSSGRADWVITASVELFLSKGLSDRAEEAFKLFDSKDVGSDSYRAADFLICHALDTPDKVLAKGRALIKTPIRYASVYVKLAALAQSQGMDEIREGAESALAAIEAAK
jgi:tetratricopeptide (TPR) repeat protein